MRFLVIIAALAASSATARADDTGGPTAAIDEKAEARRLAARAQVHYDLGEYDRAIVDYREAYRIEPSPGLLYNLGQAYRMLGDCVSATTMYRNYLRLAPRSPYRSLVKQHMSALSECNRRRTGANASGEETLIAARVDREGRLASLGVPFAATVDEEERARPGRTRKRVGLILGGAGIAVGGVAAYFAYQSDASEQKVTELYERGASWRKIAEEDARGRRAEQLGIGFAAVAGAALVGGTAMYVLGWRADENATSMMVAPEPGGTSVSVSWGF